MRSAIWCGVCSTCLTLLASLDSAEDGLGRARAVSRQRDLFSFFCQNIQASIRTYRYLPITVHVYKKHSGAAAGSLSVESDGQSFESRMTLFFLLANFTFFVGAMYFVTSVQVCTMINEVSSEQSRNQFCINAYRALLPLLLLLLLLLLCVLLYCCCCCSRAAVLLLPAAVRHRVPDGHIRCCFNESDPSVFFLFIQFANILCNCGHARSQGGRQPTAAKPPLYIYRAKAPPVYISR